MFRDTFNTLGTSGSAAVRVLVYVLAGGAKDVLVEQFARVELYYDGEAPVEVDKDSWTHVVQALLLMFPADDILRQSYDKVTRTEKKEGED